MLTTNDFLAHLPPPHPPYPCFHFTPWPAHPLLVRARHSSRPCHKIRASRGARATRASEAAKSYGSLKASVDRSTASLAADEELLQTLLTGLASASSSSGADDPAGGASGGYMGQLAQARASLSAATTGADQAQLAIDHASRELERLGPKAARAHKEGRGLSAELDRARERKAELERALERLGGEEARERDLLGRKADVSKRINDLLEVRRFPPRISESSILCSLSSQPFPSPFPFSIYPLVRP